MFQHAVALALGVLLAMHAATHAAEPKSPLDFHVKSIDGKDVNLAKYKGQVVLVVNVASFCGNTPQYATLEKMHKELAGKGLAVLGFPANEFGKQEPGSNKEIVDFCSSKYGVTFDMFEKIIVKGPGIHPFYNYLISSDTNPKCPGEIGWNFEKFLIGRDGQVVCRFKPGTKPDAPEVTKAIQAELEKK